jgi:transcriptional regulator with GAF, ATPase, and Fis domain
MNFDRNLFFYEVTTRICSSLRIEEAMYNTINYMKDYIPAREIVMGLFDQRTKLYRIIAKATSKNGILLNENYSLPKNAEENINAFMRRPAMLVNSENDPVITALFKSQNIEHLSFVVMPLTVKEQLVGVVFFFAKKTQRFSEEDARIISILNYPFSIALSNSLEHLELERQKNIADEENRYLRQEISQSAPVIGIDTGLRDIFKMVSLVAPLNSPVMLIGETGTGKEVIASAIHNKSPRRENPFIKVNCGAIPETLADSDLFGHEKGAFTGALTRRYGRFERADKGTLLLDEISELPLDLQVKLLRVIQEHEIERVGGNETIPIDVRLICTTNKDLMSLVKEKSFREDLLHRLNVFPIHVPPLRYRKDDIPKMICYFLQKKAEEMGIRNIPHVTDEDMELLLQYDWPGNVRELQNMVERALILQQDNVLCFRPLIVNNADQKEPQKASLDESMSMIIADTLRKTRGRISGPNGAAALLGLNPSTLRSRIKKFGITP